MIVQHLWQRWLSAYLSNLTRRMKWQAEKLSVSKDHLGIHKEDDVSRNK